MVEKIKHKSRGFDRTTGPIRMSVDDLIDYLSNVEIFESTTFEAYCNEYKFESLADMKANRELLAGRPKIYGMFDGNKIDDFTIKFDEGAKIHSYTVQEEAHIAILNKASTNINSYRGPLWFLKHITPTAIWLVTWGLFVLYSLVWKDLFKESNTSQLINSPFTTLMVLFVFLAVFRSLLAKGNPVFFGQRSQLVEKLKENVLSHSIVFIFGIGLTWLASKFGILS